MLIVVHLPKLFARVQQVRCRLNISKPGVTKGQHWHHTKNEKFVVVKGRGLIQLRKEGSEEILNFEVSSDKIQVVEMIPGYTHNIVNLSETDELVTLMWCNEVFDSIIIPTKSHLFPYKMKIILY